ncbi:MAG: tRNA (adenosine(37)-N6)-dimethylallyltransferase MiaA, partial [Pseudomonadota bacterium]|nr:tRNA (adenosine(37)-N6)-dimethylallyltransferase MiaA [Pseudomonadota bacterium]
MSAIYGPTASGKTALAIELAQATGAAILNADSMQVYADLRIVTTRPSEAEEAAADHRLYGILPGSEPCTVARWVALAKAEIAALAPRPVILVGGTGLYLKALYEGLSDIPEPESAVRNAAQARLDALGLAGFRAEVVARDPGTPGSVIDPQRLLRSWSVHEATGRALSHWQGERVGGLGPFPVFDLAPDREHLHARINQRFGMMLEAGALAEVAALAGQGLPSSLPIMRAVGVPELLSVLNGERDQAEATER